MLKEIQVRIVPETSNFLQVIKNGVNYSMASLARVESSATNLSASEVLDILTSTHHNLTGFNRCRTLVQEGEKPNPGRWKYQSHIDPAVHELTASFSKNDTDTDCWFTYWLPWRRRTGLYIDLPCDSPQSSLFITSTLSGCYFGVQAITETATGKHFVRVRHYNDDTLQETDMTMWDDSVWLVPNDFIHSTAFHPQYYPMVIGTYTTVWGEYIDENWHFFYQTPDNIIRLLI